MNVFSARAPNVCIKTLVIKSTAQSYRSLTKSPSTTMTTTATMTDDTLFGPRQTTTDTSRQNRHGDGADDEEVGGR